MNCFASSLIDALGGTTVVAEMSEMSKSTVHRMRSQPTVSRINHLRRVAHMERPSVDVAAIAVEHGFKLAPIASIEVRAPGNDADLTGAAS